MLTIRLNKFLADSGLCSRRAADLRIAQANIRVNGTVIYKLGTKVSPETDRVEYFDTVKKQWILLRVQDKKVTYALNKPVGYVSTSYDKKAPKTVVSLVPHHPRVYPVGRLDKDSEGLLIMTNDGELAYKLTHPKTHVAKSYEVYCRTAKNISKTDVEKKLVLIKKGIMLDGKLTLPVDINNISYLPNQLFKINITLFEGRRRQLRRVFGRMNLDVVRLIRVAIGKLVLEELHLDPGKYKVLIPEELLLLS